MDNYDEQIKPLILRLKFDIKLRKFVVFMFLRHKQLSCLLHWVDMLVKHQKYSNEKTFLEYFKHIVKLTNEPTTIDTFCTNISMAVNTMNVSDDLIIDMLKFIDLKNYE
jgi:hypothetical protein